MTHSAPSPLPYQRILVATGGAQHSQKAEQRAMQLAQFHGLPLEVVVVAPLVGQPMVNLAAAFPGGEPLELQQAESRLLERQQVLERVTGEAERLGLHVRGHLIQSLNAAQAILQVASETHADLIVLGRRHLTPLGAAMSGSVGDQVSRASGVDVLVVR